jgi:hypothetical protein
MQKLDDPVSRESSDDVLDPSVARKCRGHCPCILGTCFDSNQDLGSNVSDAVFVNPPIRPE